jgi:hypothetical protein
VQDEDGWTALIAATCYNHDDVVQVIRIEPRAR